MEHVEIDWRDRRVALEVERVGRGGPAEPLLVFLHEGLGSRSMWRDFPAELCQAVGARGLVYSRPGYGRSTPRAAEEAWDLDFLHRQAHEVLPALLDALQVDARTTPLVLFGHSDGGSIALLYAARYAAEPARAPAALVVLAPHIMVEEIAVASIEQARQDYFDTDLRERLARHHDDPDSAFWGWNDIWLKPAFRHWTIADEIGAVRCPVLAVQGVDDQYGTLEQIRGIARRLPHTELLELADCRHSAHRDQPEAVIRTTQAFLGRVLRGRPARTPAPVFPH